MTDRCAMEDCPVWDGHGCPCDLFGLDRDDLPTDGVFNVETTERSTMTDAATPPGSPAARENGCTCPVLDNRRRNAETGYVIVLGCPAHAPHTGEN